MRAQHNGNAGSFKPRGILGCEVPVHQRFQRDAERGFRSCDVGWLREVHRDNHSPSGGLDVIDAAVVGVPSKDWGETPFGFVVARSGVDLDLEKIRSNTNAGLGKTQRLSALKQVEALPRSHIGKILKTELRDSVL